MVYTLHGVDPRGPVTNLISAGGYRVKILNLFSLLNIFVNLIMSGRVGSDFFVHKLESVEVHRPLPQNSHTKIMQRAHNLEYLMAVLGQYPPDNILVQYPRILSGGCCPVDIVRGYCPDTLRANLFG